MARRTSLMSSAWALSNSVTRVQRSPSRTPHRAALTSTRMTMVFQNVSRKRSVRNRCLTGPKRIAPPSYGLDGRSGVVPVQLFANPVDVDLDDVRGAFPVGFPQVLAEHLARHHLPGVAEQQFEDAKFRGRQVDDLVAAEHAPRG